MLSSDPSRSRLALITRAAAPVLAATFVAAILLRFPPSQYSFYPRCPIHETFGLLCPGCGATRALAALLQGNLREAIRLNPLATALMPIATAYGIAFYTRFLRRQSLRLLQPPTPALYVTLVAGIAFTIARNL
ncbi:MAG TPA: DUF2752 domain-containing protein [Edaphobacter sp.]